jgi:hypothetical protein
MKPQVVKSLNEERDKELLACLETMSEHVREGHVSDIVIIAKVRGAPATEMEWGGDNPLDLIGAIEMAKIEIATSFADALNGEDEDDDED